MSIKIAIAEDNNFLAQAIQEKISFFEELKFKFRGANGAELIGKLAADHNVDVILMDIQMPEMNGIETTQFVSEKYPQIKIIMLTVLDDENHIFQAIQAGANGYILKDEPPHKLRDGIFEIIEGGAPMSAGIALKALRMVRTPLTESNFTPIETPVELSQRETEVLVQLSKGFEYKTIAANLIISPSTVRKHIENIYQKLQVHNKIEAIQKANKHRII